MIAVELGSPRHFVSVIGSRHARQVNVYEYNGRRNLIIWTNNEICN